MLKKLGFLLLLIVPIAARAQFISLRATNASQFLGDNLYDADLSRAIGAEAYYSKGVSFIPYNINYIAGLSFQQLDDQMGIFAATGLAYILRVPSGFSANNPESVTYTTSNWLNFADVTAYNGVLLDDSTYHYAFAIELGYDIGYAFTKTLFLHTGFGARYNIIPDGKEDPLIQANSLDIMIKAGLIWKFKRKYFKP
ncbi:MAG: hypothetical protein R2794_12110 [Chitinophagales bacterium]